MHDTHAPSARLRSVANLVLAGAGSACFIVLLYVLYYYALTHARAFRSAAGAVLYYGIPGLLAIGFFASLRLRATLKISLAAATVATAVSVYSAELIVDAVRPRDRSSSQSTLWAASNQRQLDVLVALARDHGVEYDTRTQLEVVRDMRAEGIDAVWGVYPLGYLTRQADSALISQFAIDGVETIVFGGISNRLTVLCNEAGEWITYRSDEHGFHNPHGLWDLPRLDVVLLGDSYTQGMCVPSDRNFAAVVRRRYPATLNLGMANMGPLIQLAMLKEYAAAHRPQHVLWFFYEQNDLSGLKNERASPMLMRYLEEDFSQDLRDLQSEIDSLLDDYVQFRLRTMPPNPRDAVSPPSRTLVPSFLRLPNLRSLFGLSLGRRNWVDPRIVADETMDLFGAILGEGNRTVKAWGGTLHLVYLPERERYAIPSAAQLDKAIQGRVLELADSIGVPVIHIDEAFETHGDPLALFPFRRRGHYNGEGHRLVGEAVLKALADR